MVITNQINGGQKIELKTLAYEYDSSSKSIVLPKGFLYKIFYKEGDLQSEYVDLTTNDMLVQPQPPLEG